MPGLGFSPLLFASSLAISWPCMEFFDSKKRIRNPNNPRISQHSSPSFRIFNIGHPIYINTSMFIYRITDMTEIEMEVIVWDKDVAE